MKPKFLFICPSFHDTHSNILDALSNRFNVAPLIYKEIDVFNVSGLKKIAVVFFRFMFQLTNLIFFEKLKIKLYRFNSDGVTNELTSILNSNEKFNFVLIIKGFGVKSSDIERIRLHSPGVYITLYQWDSFDIYSYERELVEFVDSAFSFQIEDIDVKINYLPNPFQSNYQHDPIVMRHPIGVAYIGMFNLNRFMLMRKIRKICKSRGLEYRIKLYTNNVFFYLLDKDLITLHKVNRITREAYYTEMGCVLDIGQPNQTGLTQRFFEALALGCYVVSSSPDSKIFNKKNCEISLQLIDFINGKWFIDSNIDEAAFNLIVKNNSLDSWINKLMSIS